MKEATDAAHRQVEGIVEKAGFFRSRPAYLQYLEATYRVREALERQLELSDAADVMPDWPARGSSKTAPAE
jgi:heme oxygenase